MRERVCVWCWDVWTWLLFIYFFIMYECHVCYLILLSCLASLSDWLLRTPALRCGASRTKLRYFVNSLWHATHRPKITDFSRLVFSFYYFPPLFSICFMCMTWQIRSIWTRFILQVIDTKAIGRYLANEVAQTMSWLVLRSGHLTLVVL